MDFRSNDKVGRPKPQNYVSWCVRNGPYSKCFGKWAGLSPDEVREDILQELQPLSHHRGVKDLMFKLSNGSSGEALVLINACKCIHVVKNWCFVVRSNSSSTFECKY